MLIITIIVVGIVVGYVASLRKSRLSTAVYVSTALLGALVGALLSLGDSALYLKYPILNVWTVPIAFSVAFAFMAVLADRGGMKKIIVPLFVVIAIIFGLIFLDSTPSEFGGLFREKLTFGGIERVGQPIEGFDAFMLKRAFPGLTDEDFDGVQTLEGHYELTSGSMKYKRDQGMPVTSAEQTVSSEGYATLLTHVSQRLNIEVINEDSIEQIVNLLSQDKTASNDTSILFTGSDYTLRYSNRWFPHENGPSILFTHEKDLVIPPNTEGFAIGSYFSVTVEELGAGEGSVATTEEWFERNGMTEGSDLLISRELATVRNLNMTRIVMEGAGVEGRVLHYVYAMNPNSIILLSHFPYEPNSQDTDDFEQTVQTLNVAGNNSPSAGMSIKCTPEQRNVDACIEIYQPVCAKVNIQCITMPCESVEETFSNSCFACTNPLVESYTEGECLSE